MGQADVHRLKKVILLLYCQVLLQQVVIDKLEEEVRYSKQKDRSSMENRYTETVSSTFKVQKLWNKKGYRINYSLCVPLFHITITTPALA